MKKKNLFLALVSLFTIVTFSGCDLFSGDDECSDTDIRSDYWINVGSQSAIYKITVSDPNVRFVDITATYFILRCGNDSPRAFYSVPTKTVDVKPTQTIYDALGGYYCSTQLRNYKDEFQVVLELKFYNLAETVGTKTLKYYKTGQELAEQGANITLIPEFTTSF